MIEGQPGELHGPGPEWLQGRIERNTLFRLVCHGFRFAQIGDDDGPLQPRQFCRHFGNLAGHVNPLAVIPVAVASEEKLRLDLAKTVEHALHAKIRRTGRPDGADGRSGQHEGNRLRHVGHHARDTVAGLNTLRQHELLQSRHQRMEIVPAQAPFDLVLTAKDDGFSFALMAQQVFREIEPRLRKEPCLPHMALVDKGCIAALADDLAKIPHKLPETGAILDRPAMQRGIIRQAQARALFGANAELLQIAGGDGPRIRLPQGAVMRKLRGDCVGAHHSSQNHAEQILSRSTPSRISRREFPIRPCFSHGLAVKGARRGISNASLPHEQRLSCHAKKRGLFKASAGVQFLPSAQERYPVLRAG